MSPDYLLSSSGRSCVQKAKSLLVSFLVLSPLFHQLNSMSLFRQVFLKWDGDQKILEMSIKTWMLDTFLMKASIASIKVLKVLVILKRSRILGKSRDGLT